MTYLTNCFQNEREIKTLTDTQQQIEFIITTVAPEETLKGVFQVEVKGH